MSNSGGKPGISSNSAIIVAILATGAVWFTRPAPLQTARPAPIEAHVEARFDDQDVEARLWQDPLEAIARRVEKADAAREPECPGRKGDADPDAPSRVSPHCRSPLFDSRGARIGDPERTRVIAVVAPGAPYFEDSETRRRLRYAVVSGLQSESFVPIDSQHMGYFRPLGYEKKGLPEAIPYETFRNDQGAAIILAWIDEDIVRGAGARSGGAIRRLAALHDALCPPDKCGKPLKFSILGPYSSDARINFATKSGRRFICRSGGKRKKPEKPQPLAFNVYSFAVTGEEPKVDWDLEPCAKGEVQQDMTFDFVNTIAEDKTVAAEVVKELQRRGLALDPSQPVSRQALPHVALISDSDTEYGRAVVDTFGKALESLSCARSEDGRERICEPMGRRLHKLTYLRGLDGMQPAKEDKAKKDKDDKGSNAAGPQESAFGPGQFDYLRRLASALKQEDDENQRSGNARIRAIGILGNDVFDKLLALRALRPLFPETIFFTTDFDHALANANDLEWSRNLLIASGYGPKLSDRWQAGTPPFRGAYQTSAFVAARLAAEELSSKSETQRKWVEDATRHVQLFEIDRVGDLLPLPTGTDDGDERGRAQPAAKPLYPELGPGARDGLVFLLSCAGLSILFLAWRNLLWPYLRTTWRGLALSFFLAAGVALFWNYLGDGLTNHGLGEPIAATRGVSVWPTIAIRAFGVLIALCLIIDAWFGLRRNLKRNVKAQTLFIDCPFKAPVADGAVDSLGEGVDVSPEWKEYQRRSLIRPVAARVLVCVAGMLAIFAALCAIFGWPQVPWRGEFASVYSFVTLALVLLMLVLTFLVVDATILCLRFVIFLRDNRTRWMADTRAKYVEKLGFDDPLIDDWIDLSFIAARTSCIGNLIYLPFAVSVLLIVSRSAIFANFAPSAAILIIQAIGFVILFACAMTLCFTAEQARKIAKAKVSEKIRYLKATGGKADQLEGLLKQIEDLSRGAFVPLSEQPPVRALLLPLGGIGWTALLDYRLLPGL